MLRRTSCSIQKCLIHPPAAKIRKGPFQCNSILRQFTHDHDYHPIRKLDQRCLSRHISALALPLPKINFRQFSTTTTTAAGGKKSIPSHSEKDAASQILGGKTAGALESLLLCGMESESESELADQLHIYYSRLGLSHPINFHNAYEYEQLLRDADADADGAGLYDKGWTASFICPVTATRIRAGTIRMHLRGPPSETETDDKAPVNIILEKDGKVYYESKKLAKRACAAAVVDCLSARILNDNDSLRQYCKEGPSVDLAAIITTALEQQQQQDQQQPKDQDSQQGRNTSVQPANNTDGTGWGHNAMVAVAHLHRIYNPKDLRASTISDAVTYKSSQGLIENDPSRRVYWTAQFRSPITSECFQSGILKDEDSLRIDGETFYNNKKLARMSAIGRAVDCFVHRRGWIGNNNDDNGDGDDDGKGFVFPEDDMLDYQQFCVEEPYDAAVGVEIVVGAFVPPPQKEKTTDASITPKEVINNRYQKLLRDGNTIGQDCFSNASVDLDIDGKTLTYCTSTFECPVTGKIFPSGTLINVDECASQGTAPAMKNIDGVVYYFDKKNAEHAAAGRTFDILSATNFFSSFGLNDYKVVPQFCEEDPHSYTDEYYSDDDDFDEFVIQDVPRAGGNMAGDNSNRTTMDVVLDAWADYSVQNELQEALPSSDAISTAKSWLEKMKSEAGAPGSKAASKKMTTLRQTTVSTFSCNAILKALANANYSGSADDIEALAGEIIKLMISSSSSGEELPCAPNTSTFASYIRCFQSASPLESAKRAEKFLDDMLNGKVFEGAKLPEPDCEFFNAVMKQWFQVPDQNYQRRIAALFNKLEFTANTTSNDLRPNKESYLVALESLAMSEDEFNPIEAQKWIDRMLKHVAKSDDDDMIVDTEVYNAALPLPVDQYHLTEYIKSVYNPESWNKDKPSKANAIKVENWFHEMERLSVEEGKLLAAPDMDTYEAVIQAWIKLGSEEGLLKAEKWALLTTEAAAIDSDISPRLSTFRALALAWAWSGSAQAPERLESIFQQLDSLSETFPELTPDGELRSLLLVAWQNQRITESNRSLSDVAQDASDYLNSIIDTHGGSGDFFLAGDVFLNLNNLHHKAANESTQNTPKVASDMIQTIRVFNKYAESFPMLKKIHNDLSKDAPKETIDKYLRIFNDGDVVYEEVMKSMLSATEGQQEENKTLVERHFHEIERFLLRRDKLQRTYCPSTNEWGVHGHDLPIPSDLFLATLNWCKYLTNPTRNGEAVRLTMDIFRWTLNCQRQDMISQSKAIDIYAEVMEVVSAVVATNAEKALLVKKIVDDIIESNPGNNRILSSIKSRVPAGIDTAAFMTKARQPIERKYKSRKRVRKRRM